MKKTIVAISRAYGAHGTTVGAKLAAKLGVPMFDKKIIDLASEKSGLSPEYIGKLEENITGSFLFNLASGAYNMHGFHGGYNYEMPMTYTAFTAQANAIQEIAKKGSSVIIGRCSDYLLREDPDCIKVFLYAEPQDRLEQCKAEFNLDDKAAEQQLRKFDRNRSNYYKNFTGENWGHVYAHDLSLNTTKVGIDGAVELIMEYLKRAGRL